MINDYVAQACHSTFKPSSSYNMTFWIRGTLGVSRNNVLRGVLLCSALRCAAHVLLSLCESILSLSILSRTLQDFGDGGAFPEIHLAQYPMNLGKPAESEAKTKSNALAVQLDASGKVKYDLIARQGHGKVDLLLSACLLLGLALLRTQLLPITELLQLKNYKMLSTPANGLLGVYPA